jgi:hypothetical protein
MAFLLLSASLVLVLAMLGSLGWLTVRREAVRVESSDDTV